LPKFNLSTIRTHEKRVHYLLKNIEKKLLN
jgi:hypothetical protein